MTVALPESIAAYFAAEREGGPDELAAAVVRDAGERLVGQEAIRRWKAEYTQKYGTVTAEPFFVTAEKGRTQVTAHVTGDFPGSPVDLRYFFVMAGDRIAELEITV